MIVEMLTALDQRFAVLDKEIARDTREEEMARWLMTILGIGPIEDHRRFVKVAAPFIVELEPARDILEEDRPLLVRPMRVEKPCRNS